MPEDSHPRQGHPVRAPRPVYLDDPRLDRLLGALVELTAQLYVAKDRVRALEELLMQKGILTRGELDNFKGDADLEAILGKEREALIQAVITKNLFEG